MKFKVIGIEHKEGVFKRREDNREFPYNNFNLHCVGKSMKVTGDTVRVIKLKAQDASGLIAECGGRPEQIIGHTIDFDLYSDGGVANYELVK